MWRKLRQIRHPFRRSRAAPTGPLEGRRQHHWYGLRSVAGQVFLLQSVIVVLVIAATAFALALHARHESESDARHRSLGVAEGFAQAPGVPAALRSADPTAVLQEPAERARRASGVDFVSVLNRSGIRYTDPAPGLIGRRAAGDWPRALRGESFTEKFKGAPSEAIRAVVPVTDARGSVVGVVTAGVQVTTVSEVVNRELPLLLGAGAVALALAVGGAALVSRRLKRQTHGLEPAEVTRMYEHHDAVLHSVREGVLIVDGDQRLLLANDEARRLLELPARSEGRPVHDLGLAPEFADLLAACREVTDEVHRVHDRLLAISCRPTGQLGGSVATLRDTTELRALTGRAEVARERLQLLYDAGVRVGTTLDVTRTAEELTQVAVPRFADAVTVDLLEPVLHGEEPGGKAPTALSRTAAAAAPGVPPLPDEPATFLPDTPQPFNGGRAALFADLTADSGWRGPHPQQARALLEHGMRSLVVVPICVGEVTLGVAHFWRTGARAPFERDDLSAAEELVARAAVCIDNARRYTREHAMAVSLQRSLLPRGLPEQNALEVAHRYQPARGGVGGDWFDVIALPGARVALVVGDVVGHGLHAAATMGRLRTAIHNFAALDLPPDELLSRLDELVARIDQDRRNGSEGFSVTGATVLYAVYDSVSGRCTLARAGHPPPAVAWPDGTVTFPDVPPGQPLGLSQLPFEATEIDLPQGSRLVLYTDGLVQHRDRDIDEGLDLLRAALSRTDRSAEQTCVEVCRALLTPGAEDDIALLVARTRRLPADHVAVWEVPHEPEAVAPVRTAAVRQLHQWGLAEAAFTTELILSELITNAIRYGTPPVTVRLLRDRVLTCEVFDASSTSPHLRYAATTDEGGRGLYLVAHLAERWGTRYTPEGKIIWTEQPLTASPDSPPH
ncbi:SpoIIE family protein phosphatase [Streptomyces lydicus]|uniref:SpoIIE family protein phosphatase n=1 Tax=Streptomyces lydicus TaxID=47763 RepID=UPI000996C171|nr:SpoIIE family protein phosphatase [Streptomyces lydicus]UEG89541.1 SpoIIE family protein phosphatase [Streptomyces lydicus]